jgi:nitrogen fixation-related uncharacterized protein
MRFLPNTHKRPAYRLYLTVFLVSTLAFFWAVATAQESEQQAEKTEQIVADKQKTQSPPATEQKDKLHIGTFNPQQAFSMYYGTQNLRKQIQQLQTENEMTKEQMQQMVNKEQKQLIQQFQSDLSEVIAQSAQDADVPVIAIQVVYRKPSVKIDDLTADLVQKINEQARQRDQADNQPDLEKPLTPETDRK